MTLPDTRTLTAAQHEAASLHIKRLPDITDWPDLKWFNSSPCARHAPELSPLCRTCGVVPRAYQRVGAAWMYLGLPGLLADTMGPQPLDAKVLTPGGWAEMGSLQPGTQVVDPDGELSQVAEVIPQGTQDVYQVTFSDGTTAESTLGHLWQVRGWLDKRSRSEWQVRTLGEIRQGKSDRAVPLIRKAPDLAIPDRFLPVDPYLVGLLLGDGSLTGGPEFGSADPELLVAAKELLPEGWGWTFSRNRTGCRWYRLNGSQPVLRQLDMFGKRSWEKSVPELYKWTSAAARLALLQGLMDTDGCWAGCAGAEFSSTSRQLAEDVADLGRSLGLRTSKVRVKKSSYRSKKDGELKRCRDSYRVTIAPAPGTDLFRLPRKLKPPPGQRISGDLANAGKRAHHQRDQRVKWIRTIEYSRTVPVQCIRVTAPSQLYVTDNWTVTHNSGKTIMAIMALAMYKQMGWLGYENRAVIICKSAAVGQWGEQLARLAPGLDVLVASGDPKERRAAYDGLWEVVVISDRTFAPAAGAKTQRPGDVAILVDCPVTFLFYDDTDAMRSPGTATCTAVNRLAGLVLRRGGRVHGLHGTPLQKKLIELYSFLVPVGGRERLGSAVRVRQRYVTRSRKIITMPDRSDPSGRRRVRRPIWVDSGINQDAGRVREFRRLISPLVLRRTAADLNGAGLPEIQVNPIFMDLLPRQRERYEQLREGVLLRLREGGEQIEYTAAAAAFTRGQQICGGLASLDEGPEAPGSSVKLDWVMDALTGDLAAEKVVCFVYHKGNVRALSARLSAESIGHVLMWSGMTDQRRRTERLRLFREDDRARVLIGTTTIEASLDLQAARHLIAVDTILNPARMAQLTGRIRRLGSPFSMVFLHHLLCRETQEEAYLPLLGREQEVADIVWDERSDIFKVLSPRQLMQLVAYGRLRAAA